MKFKKLIQTVTSAALSLTLAISSCPMEQVFAAANEKRPYIVVPKDGYMQTIRNKYLDRLSETVTTVLDHVSKHILLLDLTSVEAFALEYLTGIAAISEDIDVVALTDGTTGEVTPEWNMQMIHADAAPQEVCGEKVKVAIIDSGIDDTPDITVQERKNFVPGEEEVYICFDDTTGHGTSIAGIIAATGAENGVAGINPNVELYSAKIFDFDMAAPVSRVIEAIYWAIEKDVDIINLSFGTTQNNEALYQAVKAAYDAGILIVAAAGNSGTVEYPAAYPEVMAVGSVNSMGESAEATAEGAALEITAPGELIASTSHFGGIGVTSGTSLAAPHVVGVASVLWQKDLSKSNEFIRTVLCASANASDETAYGYGTVDLAYALEVYEQLKDTEIAASVLTDVDAVIEDNAIEENTDAIETTENDYVEGRWYRNEHEDLVEENNGNFNSTSTHQTLLTCLKKGTRANDTYIPGMEMFPELHGYYPVTINNSGAQSNYIFAYFLLIDIAQYMYTAYGNSTAAAFSISDSAYASAVLNSTTTNVNATVQSRLQRIFDSLTTRITQDGILGYRKDPETNIGTDEFCSWSTVFTGDISTQPNGDDTANSLGTPNGAKICAFVYGMAAHHMADIFAHSTYAKQDNGSTYTYILHKTDHIDMINDPENKYKYDADDPYYFPNRFKCATEAVGKVVDHYYTNGSSLKTDGSIDDFVLSSYDNSFKVRNIYTYALQATNGKATSNTLTDTQISYFTDINITVS